MIEAARDVDPVALTVQCRYLEHWLDIGSNEEQLLLIDWISTALAQLAGVDVRRDPSIRTEFLS
jgi:hypothetical protein